MGEMFHPLRGIGGSRRAGASHGLPGLHGWDSESARKFHWPACEEYDRRFRQVAAGDEARPWATMEPGLFADPAGRGNQLGSLAGSRKRQIGRRLQNRTVRKQEPLCV